MNIQHSFSRPASLQPSQPTKRGRKRIFQSATLLAALLASTASHAIDFGPDGMFSFTGFGQVVVEQQSNYCFKCQVSPDTGRHKSWTDAILQGSSYGTVINTNYQFQPYLGAKLDLGKGFKLSGLVSQNFRQSWVNGMDQEVRYVSGAIDQPGFWRELNVALSHEEYGRLTIGHMGTRAYGEASFPYGSNIGLSDHWAVSGAAYGLLTNAIRYESRIIDFAGGDLILEATYDQGKTGSTLHKPVFWELHAKLYRGPLHLQVTVQDTKNGAAQAYGKGPFVGLTTNTTYDTNPLLKDTSQGLAMVMARYFVDSQLELSGGIRRNWWSGADEVFLPLPGTINPTGELYNSMFNVDFNSAGVGVPGAGVSASSVDIMLGARYKIGQWTPSLGFVHLGKAETSNPTPRGQGNSALFTALGLQYDFGNGAKIDFTYGAVQYAYKGLAPLSMPAHDAFTAIDSRVTQHGNWLSVGFIYTF